MVFDEVVALFVIVFLFFQKKRGFSAEVLGVLVILMLYTFDRASL